MAKTNFIDANPSQGILGTLVTASFLNNLGLHRHDGLDDDGHCPLDYYVAGGTANAITVALNPPLTAHIPGMPIYIKLTDNNTGAATVNINGLGAVGLIRPGGIGLAAGDLKSGDIICIVYNGTTYEVVSGISSAATLADITTAIANDNAVNLFPRIGSDGPASCRNKINNPRFAVNQRGVYGTVVLSAGAFGHDRWRAGTSGCTYTVSTTNGRNALNITAGSLVQTIEGRDLPAGVNTMCLSWGGTCQGKIGAGSYGASGITGEATGGTDISVEFGTGTLYEPQFEHGTVASKFDCLPDVLEEVRCRRYFRGLRGFPVQGAGTTVARACVRLEPPMRCMPTAWLSDVAKLENGTSIHTQSARAISILNTIGAAPDAIALQIPNFKDLTVDRLYFFGHDGPIVWLSSDI